MSQVQGSTVLAQAWREKAAMLAALVFLVCGFSILISWYHWIDIYNQHFYDHGKKIFAYNVTRILLLSFILWIVYVSGQAILSLIIPTIKKQQLSLTERILLGFGTGYGFWQLVLLVLGIFNFYYFSLMFTICMLVLCCSTKHFTFFISELKTATQIVCFNTSINYRLGFLVTFLGVTAALGWVLLVRGLYPGGGGDFYTHYFYYYIDVIRLHGLQPNDVWYHYYYSKGSGLTFLGMLLMDPQAMQLITFGCVAVATLAVLDLANKMAPHSFWPLCCTLIYLLCNLVALDTNVGGGEFHKMHEQSTALLLIAVWGLCLYDTASVYFRKALLVMISSVMIGLAIFSQVVAVLFAGYFGLKTFIGIIKKNPYVWHYFFLGTITCSALASVFLLNYVVTGLATDQVFNFTWRFANLERLNQWGVIPNLVLMQWIRDHYEIPPWGWESFKQLSYYLRFNVIGLLPLSGLFVLLHYFIEMCLRKSSPRFSALSISLFINITLMTFTFACMSVVIGHDQSVSYFRFSSFFVPLLALFSVCCWGMLLSQYHTHSFRWILTIEVPLILVILTVLYWSEIALDHWSYRVKQISHSAKQFMLGHYSLAEGYENQYYGLPFGGIHPGVAEAYRHVPLGARIWSTNVDSYCMLPNCRIESNVSFKLSPHMNEILNGTPDQAKQILQAEGLNYFIISSDSRLIDIMPYSKLFNPAVISQYFAIKWTDGKTYLLTWHGPDTKPLDAAFMQLYTNLLHQPEHPWFKFSKSVAQLDKFMKTLESSSHPWKPINFPWQHPDMTRSITILSATYGKSCANFKTKKPYLNNVFQGNATMLVKDICDEKMNCRFTIDPSVFGDPVNGCGKDFIVSYQCPLSTKPMTALISAEASGKEISIVCRNKKMTTGHFAAR